MKRYVILAASLSVLGFASAHAQTFPSPSGDNSAEIAQRGNQNTAEIDQTANGFALNGENRAEISQVGNRNTATVNQTSAAGVFEPSFANTALVEQNRNRGIASVDQIHDYATTRFNEARILQNSNDAEASIGQRGDRNTARIFQRGGSIAPDASVEQNGRSNIAIVNQRAGASGEVDVRQGAFGGGIILSPQTFTSRVDVDHNGANADIFVSQIGFTHNADIFEDGTNGIIDVRMDGALNSVEVRQESSNGIAIVESTSSSFSNLALVTQGASDNGSVVFVEQSGSNSISDVEQLGGTGIGTGNFADVNQSGDGLTAGSIDSLVLQNGSLNVALVDQASQVAASAVYQTGVGHVATITQ